jgi:hypothetical protein
MRIGGYLRRGAYVGKRFQQGRFVEARGGPPTLAPRLLTVMVLECVVCTDSPGAVNHRPESSDKGSQR